MSKVDYQNKVLPFNLFLFQFTERSLASSGLVNDNNPAPSRKNKTNKPLRPSRFPHLCEKKWLSVTWRVTPFI